MGYESYLTFIMMFVCRGCHLTFPIVCEFPNNFPTNLLSFPPENDIKFAIDHKSGTQRISMVPNYMDPIELK